MTEDKISLYGWWEASSADFRERMRRCNEALDDYVPNWKRLGKDKAKLLEKLIKRGKK